MPDRVNSPSKAKNLDVVPTPSKLLLVRTPARPVSPNITGLNKTPSRARQERSVNFTPAKQKTPLPTGPIIPLPPPGSPPDLTRRQLFRPRIHGGLASAAEIPDALKTGKFVKVWWKRYKGEDGVWRVGQVARAENTNKGTHAIRYAKRDLVLENMTGERGDRQFVHWRPIEQAKWGIQKGSPPASLSSEESSDSSDSSQSSSSSSSGVSVIKRCRRFIMDTDPVKTYF